MNVLLFIKFEDMTNYSLGKTIKASTENNIKYIFDNHNDDLINVLVPSEEIVGKHIKELNGMIQGKFTYYEIRKNLFK